jgi:hypothetical protein
MSIGSLFLAVTLILWGLVTTGVLGIGMDLVAVLAIITGIIILVESSGVVRRIGN